MRKIITVLFSLFILENESSAQLVNSVDFSTGFNNVTNLPIPLGQADPNWIVTNLTSPFVGTPPFPAIVQNPWTGGPINPIVLTNTRWISYDTTSMSSGNIYDNVGGKMTLKYTFETCYSDSINFSATILCDDYISAIRIDGVSASFSQPPVVNPANWSVGSSFSRTISLSPGIHTFEIDVMNVPSSGSVNAIGLDLQGTITGTFASLIDRDNNPAYVCGQECPDTCYWRVTGNNIYNNNNILGSNSNHGIKIRTNSIDRGFIATGNSTTGGYLGWNTMNPTARLHVNCSNGNTAVGTSDIRFENLESGLGTILAITGSGYVVNSGYDLPVGGWGNFWNVNSNSITGGNNIFGTSSNDGIRIRTNAINRGFIATGNSTTGGFLGWNTMNPTARLHVNCANGNTGSGLSDIRFENLESGYGNLLAINNQGYVFKTNYMPVDGNDFWNVNGNNIGGGPNFFGTNTSDDVILRTDNIDRGIMTSGTGNYGPGDDGRLGWQTTAPTAHLHVNCKEGNNPDEAFGGLSDIRFEGLEPGRGYILVIDDEGYVYRSSKRVEEYEGKAADDKIETLEKQIDELKNQLNALLNEKNGGVNKSNQSILFQNSPNPFSRETIIEYYLYDFSQSAYITINDLNGKMLYKYPLIKKGNGKITVNAQNMATGLYLYSLIIDGKEIDTKRMVIDK